MIRPAAMPWVLFLSAGCLVGTLARAESVPMPDVSGAYPVVMETDAALPDHTIYRPANLAAARRPLPVIAFGNGGCANIGNSFQKLLAEVASHGYVIAAAGPISAEVQRGERPQAMGAQSRTEQMTETLDWAVRVNGTAGSPYKGRLNTRKMALAGQSCGGLQALAAGKDPRVATVVILNSGTIRGGIPNPDGTTRQPSGYLPSTEKDLAGLHTPILYLIGGSKDQAYPGAEGDFTAITSLPIFNANLEVGHGGTWQQPRGGEMAQVAVAWLNWQLQGSSTDAKLFRGANCGLCRDARWTVKSKNIR